MPPNKGYLRKNENLGNQMNKQVVRTIQTHVNGTVTIQLRPGLTERINIRQIIPQAMINKKININTAKLPQQCDITVQTRDKQSVRFFVKLFLTPNQKRGLSYSKALILVGKNAVPSHHQQVDMGYHIYDWSARRCSTYCVVHITVLGYKDSNTSDGQILTLRYHTSQYVPLHKLLIIVCWAYGLNPTILFEGVNHLGLVTLESSHSKMKINAS